VITWCTQKSKKLTCRNVNARNLCDITLVLFYCDTATTLIMEMFLDSKALRLNAILNIDIS